MDSVSGKNPFKVELHAFLRNLSYVKSAYNIDTYSIVNDKDYPSLSLQIHRDLEDLNVPPTEYRVVYNFLRDFIGSYDSKDKMFISEISDDRTELKVSLINPN